jgi:diguanylate cyclase (GGDEF)-like protein
MVLLAEINGVADAETVARKIVNAMLEPHRIGDKELVITFSIGISICPDDATDDEMMIKHADDAMYQAKDSGRNNYKLFA